MPSIGSITFVTLDGSVGKPGTELQDITRHGVSGKAYRSDAKRAEAFTLRSMRDIVDSDGSGFETEKSAYLALQGTLVTVVDALGKSHSNIAVLKVGNITAKRCETIGGGVTANSNTQVEATWYLDNPASS